MDITVEGYGSPSTEPWGRFMSTGHQRINMSESDDDDRERPDIETQVAFKGDFDADEDDGK